MTGAELIRKAQVLAAAARPGAVAAANWAWEHRTWVLLALVVILSTVAVRSCRRAEEAGAQAAEAARRSAGEALAEAAGVPVVRQVEQPAVDEAGAAARRRVPELEAQLARAEKELGRLRLELVAHVETAGAPAQAAVPIGQQLRLGADLAVAADPSGAHTLHGTLEARLPGGELVTRQPYSAPVTVARQVSAPCPPAPPLERAWRAGAVGGATGRGWVVGAAAARRLDLWGWRPEVVATASGGPGGVVLLAGVLF